MQKLIFALAVVTIMGLPNADARWHGAHTRHTYRVVHLKTYKLHSSYRRRIASRLWHGAGRRPARWCGWYMRRFLHFGNSSYNMARQWRHYGRPSHGPRIGAVIVWRHHVGIIVDRSRGRWVIHQGNYRHRIATVAASNRWVRRAIAFRISETSLRMAELVHNRRG
jgi:hypothetical protein